MTAVRGPGVRQVNGAGTTPREHRLAIAGQYAETAPGVPRSGLLTQGLVNVVAPTPDTGTLSYAVGPVPAVIGRTVGEGAYTPTTSGTTIVPTTAAPASGSRWDLVWIKQNDPEKGEENNEAVLGVAEGTSAGTPGRPTSLVPDGALVIAEARIFAGTTSTAQSPNTVTQVFPITAARGAPIPVRNQAEADALPKWVGLQVARLDARGWVQTWDGARWQAPPFAEASGYATLPTVIAGGNSGVAITFPAGRFTLPPIMSLTTESFRVTAGTSVPTTSGTTAVGYNPTNITTGSSVRVHWVAKQMTPTSAAG